MNQSLPAGFSLLRCSPERRAFLAARFLCAECFRPVELPEMQPDFHQSGAFLTLAVAVADEQPAVFTVAARPAYEDGTVARWLGQWCVREGLEHGRVLQCRLGGLRGVTCEVVQHSASMPMRGRVVFLEDGGRLYKVAAMAPDGVWEKFSAHFGVMFQSFELEDVRGATSPLTSSQLRAQSRPMRPVLLSREEWDELVLAPDASSFETIPPLVEFSLPQHASVPGIVSLDDTSRLAVVAAPSVEGTIRVPFGWRVVDDGTRVVIFDARSGVRLVLEEHAHGGRTLHQLADDFAGEHGNAQRLRASTTLLFDDIVGLELRTEDNDDAAIDRAYLLRDIGRPGCVLVASVEAGRGSMRPARNLAGEVLAGFESMHAAAAN